MPHKHTRRGIIDKSTVDLPPNEIAKPLAVSKSAAANGIFTTELNVKRNNKKRKRKADASDDTPKAFARLMAFQRGERLPKALDDGVKVSKNARKKQKLTKDNVDGDNLVQSGGDFPQGNEVPKIRPGERMSEFAARVDAALPVSGLISKTTRGGKDPLGLKVGRTQKEKKMHRMYDEWREEEKRIQERRMEALDLAEEEEMGEDEHGQVRWKADLEEAKALGGEKGKKGKGKKNKVLGEVDDGDDDPWAKIKRDRAETKAGLHDVVQAPPAFSKVPKERFKVRGAQVDVGNVPKASGSLRRREELGDERRSVVESYRAMMRENRARADQ